MPSPFPGMDPFLEDPALFPDLHDRLIASLSETLQARLPEPYYAAIGSRVWVETSRRFIEPDAEVLRPTVGTLGGASGNGGVAVSPALRTGPVVVRVPAEWIHVVDDERRRTFVEIYTRQDERERLVTLIEVLSLTNKAPGEHGRDLYLRKQREVLFSRAHLVEIDLLRGGQHTTGVPLDRALECTGPFDYHVCMHRFDKLEEFSVWPIRLEQQLPEIAIPLLPDDPEVALDLQAVFDHCYDAGPYRRRVRYAELTPVPPLRPDQAEWVNRLLREKGLLPPA